MNRAMLAELLVNASNAEREALLRENSALSDVELAYVLKEICYDAFTVAPTRSVQAASALRALNQQNNEGEINALAEWVGGIAALVEGQMESAISRLDAAETRLLSLGKDHTAAATQVSKLIALAMLGRYDEAIECGLRAREMFLAHDDLLAAGKIEHNIGNIYFRRDQYSQAEEFQRAARQRFIAAGDQIQIAKIENSLALTLSAQHKIRPAEELYEQALARAEAVGLLATQAEIESSIGMLALYQGRYDRALDYLERSRRKYVELKMPHVSAMTEQEIADAYLELNLAPEASEIYERVAKTFAELGLRAEEARALLFNSRAAILAGHTERAHGLLARARELYLAEVNTVGVAMVQLTEAQLLYGEGRFSGARDAAAAAQSVLATAGTLRRSLVAQWLVGECARAEYKLSEAETLLRDALAEAESQEQPDIASRCNTSLGLLAEAAGDCVAAEECFKRSIAITEELRAPLPAEEFRSAFFSDKLVPYHAMVRICLEDGDDRIAEALAYVEQARGRALADAVGGSVTIGTTPRDEFEADLFARLEALRQELNYFYRQLDRPVRGDAAHSEAELTELHQALRERERKSLEIMRQLRHRGEKISTQVEALDIAALQRDLGRATALVEFASIDDELLAFVVTDESIETIRNLGSEASAAAALGQLRFQIDALRHGSERVRRHLPDLTRRAQRHLESLYDLLWRPIEEKIGKRRVVIVPHRALHYLPFQALHDGATYLIERHEVSYAPSALVLQQCLRRDRRSLSKALLLGVADEQTPRVRDEIEAIAPLFPETIALQNDDATIEALRRQAPFADVVHLACHGQFRPDNPLFSSLKLGDGWLTVREAYDLNLHCALVTLSACETGVSAVAPGDELIGLARGFFAAGSPSLLISLWTVDDDATAELMTEFYKNFRQTGSPAAALRHAQLSVMKTKPHPFFWSPFVLVGKW
jgi:CHAT domain-containing protein